MGKLASIYTIICSTVLVCCLFSCNAIAKETSAVPHYSIDALLSAVSERIAIADEVALTKWDQKRPVLDDGREAQVVAQVTRLAPQYGIDGLDAASFFRAQMEANKFVQYQDLYTWQLRNSAPHTHRPNLLQLRKRLDILQGTILMQFASASQWRLMPNCRFATAQAVAGYSHRTHMDVLHQLALVRAMGDFCRTSQLVQQPVQGR